MSKVNVEAERTVAAHLEEPTGPGPHPGVVVLHEVSGLNADIRAQARRLADHGYLALAPDLYSGGPRALALMQTLRDVEQGAGETYAIIDAARRHLLSLPACSGRVGVLGFGMGGGFALLAAPRGFQAASVNYGQVPDDVEQRLAGSCPVVASYGSGRGGLADDAVRLARALRHLGVPHDVKVYEGPGHSFMNRHRGPFRVVEKVLGIGYRHDDAEDAWTRILATFARYLGEPEAEQERSEARPAPPPV